jgi:hypothetical protein
MHNGKLRGRSSCSVDLTARPAAALFTCSYESFVDVSCSADRRDAHARLATPRCGCASQPSPYPRIQVDEAQQNT